MTPGSEVELDADPFQPTRWRLRIDGVLQSFVDLEHPTELVYAFAQSFGLVIETLLPAAPAPLRVLHVGGGALTMPRYVEATRPGSRQIVLEPDADLVHRVLRDIPLPDGSDVEVRAQRGEDGVAAELDVAGPASYDLVLVDAFVGDVVPPPMLERAFHGKVRDLLAPAGVLAMNTAGRGSWGPLEDTLSEVWPYRARLAQPHALAATRGPVVQVAGRELEVDLLAGPATALTSPQEVQPY